MSAGRGQGLTRRGRRERSCAFCERVRARGERSAAAPARKAEKADARGERAGAEISNGFSNEAMRQKGHKGGGLCVPHGAHYPRAVQSVTDFQNGAFFSMLYIGNTLPKTCRERSAQAIVTSREGARRGAGAARSAAGAASGRRSARARPTPTSRGGACEAGEAKRAKRASYKEKPALSSRTERAKFSNYNYEKKHEKE